MIRAVEDMVGDHLVRGVASVPFGIRETLVKNQLEHLIPAVDGKVELLEGAKFNLPDEECVEASKKIVELARRCECVLAILSHICMHLSSLPSVHNIRASKNSFSFM